VGGELGRGSPKKRVSAADAGKWTGVKLQAGGSAKGVQVPRPASRLISTPKQPNGACYFEVSMKNILSTTRRGNPGRAKELKAQGGRGGVGRMVKFYQAVTWTPIGRRLNVTAES